MARNKLVVLAYSHETIDILSEEWREKVAVLQIPDDEESFPFKMTGPMETPRPPRGPRLRGSMSEMMERLNRG